MSNMRVCPNHRDEYETPLLWTFAFHGKEWWCPYCGWTTGTFFSDHSDKVAQPTEEQERRHRLYKVASEDYLRSLHRGGPEEWEYGRQAEALDVDVPELRAQCVCDGCGKVAKVERVGDKPSHWFGGPRGLVACSRTCIDCIAKEKDVSSMVMPW